MKKMRLGKIIRAKKKRDLYEGLEKRDVIYRKIIDYGIIGLIIWSPLPAASVYEWSILVMQLTVLVMVGAYFLMKQKPNPNELLNTALKWPKYLFFLLFVFIFIQVFPFPKFLPKLLNPHAFSFRELFSPDFSKAGFTSFSLVPSHTLREGLEFLTYFLLGFLIIKTVTHRRQMMRLYYALIIMGVFEAFYGLFELYNKNPRILFYKKIYNLDSVTGTFVNRNHLSGYLEMIIPLAIGLIIARIDLFTLAGTKFREKIIKISEKGLSTNLLITIGIIIMSLGIIFSKSRSGVFLLVFTFLLIFELTVLFFSRIRRQQTVAKNFIKVTFLIIALISLYIGIGSVIERFSMDKLLYEGRPLYWSNVSTIIGDFPLFGTGLGTFAAVYPSYEEVTDLTPGKLSHAHNDFLEYTSELGLIGGILFFGGIIWMFVNTFRIWTQRRHPQVKGLAMGGMIALVAIGIHSISDFNLHIPANMLLFSVILSLTMVTAFYQKRETEESVKSEKLKAKSEEQENIEK